MRFQLVIRRLDDTVDGVGNDKTSNARIIQLIGYMESGMASIEYTIKKKEGVNNENN